MKNGDFSSPHRKPEEEPQPPGPPESPFPDIAFQLSICLDKSIEQVLVDALRSGIKVKGERPYVLVRCVEGTSRVGLWFRQSESDLMSRAREQSLERIRLLHPHPGIVSAIFFRASLIRSLAQEQLNEFRNKLRAKDIHPTSISIIFESPDRVVTRVNGYAEIPGPNVGFQLIITETLSVSSEGKVKCVSKYELNVEREWYHYFEGALLMIGFASLWITMPLVSDIYKLLEGSMDEELEKNVGNEGVVGAGFGVAQMIPSQKMINGGKKIVIKYDRVEVNSEGIAAEGIVTIEPRTPRVSIKVPEVVPVIVKDYGPPFQKPPVTCVVSVLTKDMREPLQIHWMAEGEILSPGKDCTDIRFNNASNAFPKPVSVRITDSDGLTAEAKNVVRFHLMTEKEREDQKHPRRQPD